MVQKITPWLSMGLKNSVIFCVCYYITVKRYMNAMQEKGIIKRKNGKRNGEWGILVDID